MTDDQKKRVLLCGTQYGQIYLPAIAQEQELELVGILARGSDRSVRLSEQQGVSLYTDIEQIDEIVDIACVAINENIGTPIADRFLQQGIATLVEHPMSINNIRQLLDTAQEYSSRCHINTHFSSITPVADFIQHSQKLNQRSRPKIINVSCNSRTLFSSLDILMRCLGCFTLKDLSVNAVGDYRNCTMLLDDIPCTLTYQQWRYKQDNSMDSPLGHQITVTYSDGVLSLGGTYGPSLWFPLVSGDLPLSMHLCQNLQSEQSEFATVSTMRYWRQQANQMALREISRQQHSEADHHSNKYQIYLCELWTSLISQLGTHTIEMPDHLKGA